MVYIPKNGLLKSREPVCDTAVNGRRISLDELVDELLDLITNTISACHVEAAILDIFIVYIPVVSEHRQSGSLVRLSLVGLFNGIRGSLVEEGLIDGLILGNGTERHIGFLDKTWNGVVCLLAVAEYLCVSRDNSNFVRVSDVQFFSDGRGIRKMFYCFCTVLYNFFIYCNLLAVISVSVCYQQQSL